MSPDVWATGLASRMAPQKPNCVALASTSAACSLAFPDCGRTYIVDRTDGLDNPLCLQVPTVGSVRLSSMTVLTRRITSSGWLWTLLYRSSTLSRHWWTSAKYPFTPSVIALLKAGFGDR